MRRKFLLFLLFITAIVLSFLVVDLFKNSLKKDSPSTTPEIKIQEKNASNTPPSFDVARIDEYGYLILAGRSEPSAELEIIINKSPIATVQANELGEWLYQPANPLQAGKKRIDIKQIGNPQMPPPVFLTVSEPAIEQTTEPAIEQATEQNTVQDTTEQNTVQDTEQAAIYPTTEQTTTYPAKAIQSNGAFTLDAIDYNDDERVLFQGLGLSDHHINLYLNDKLVGSQKIDENNKWSLIADEKIENGHYELRLDLLANNGQIVQRSEFPFQRNATTGFIAEGSHIITVQEGNNLWSFAQRTFGYGALYTIIYNQNLDQIKDPDLIYPGQVFRFQDN